MSHSGCAECNYKDKAFFGIRDFVSRKRFGEALFSRRYGRSSHQRPRERFGTVGGVRRIRVHRRRPDSRRIDEGFRQGNQKRDGSEEAYARRLRHHGAVRRTRQEVGQKRRYDLGRLVGYGRYVPAAASFGGVLGGSRIPLQPHRNSRRRSVVRSGRRHRRARLAGEPDIGRQVGRW